MLVKGLVLTPKRRDPSSVPSDRTAFRVEEESEMGKYFVWLGIGVVAMVAYFYGAKAGRGRYRDIRASIDAMWNDPKVKKARKKALKRAEAAARSAMKQVKKSGSQR